MRRAAILVVAAAGMAFSAGVSGCRDQDEPSVRVTGGSPSLGAKAIRHYGCGSCHTIPGIKGADALVGPPLVHFSKRSYVAGELTNTPANLARWISDPQSVEPGTVMPDLDVTPTDARNIAAYLLSLR